MERIGYLKLFGSIVKHYRKEVERLSQINFYNLIMPNSQRTDENIKKKMNAIENGKEKNIDMDFLFAIKSRYNLSLDYIFGFETEYKNFENKYLCSKFGLKEFALEKIEQLSQDKEFDLRTLQTNTEEADDYYFRKMSNKDDAIIILRVINFLCDEDLSGKKPYSNMSILYMIYNYCMTSASLIQNECKNNGIVIKNTNNTFYSFDPKSLYFNAIKDKMFICLEQLKERYQTDYNNCRSKLD